MTLHFEYLTLTRPNEGEDGQVLTMTSFVSGRVETAESSAG
jgi:hypothetical protein